MPDLGGGNMLEKILSLKVADVVVTLVVGLLISGMQEEEYIKSRNSCDSLLLPELIKLRLKSPAIRQYLFSLTIRSTTPAMIIILLILRRN